MFEKGHKLSSGGKRIGSGRKKSLSTLIKLAIENDSQNLPQYFKALSEKATDGDREACIYLIDRHLGKPKQQTGIDLSGGEKLSAGFVRGLFEILEEKQKEMNRYGIQGQGDTKELSEGLGSTEEDNK